MTETDDPRIGQAVRQLVARLAKFRGAPLRKETFDDINALVKDHRRQCRMHGIDFPHLTALVLTGVGAIEMVRKDLDLKGVQTIVVNLTRRYPQVTPEELARAVGWAFPWYRPSHIDMSVSRVRATGRVNGNHG